MKTTIVSAANAPFFPLLSDLLLSIEACRPDHELDVCILDVGLTPEQRHQLLTGAAGVRVGAEECAGDPMPDCACLAGEATPGDQDAG